MFNLLIVRIDSKYCDYLRKFDHRVSYNKNQKQLRPFIGILFKIDKWEYFAPLTSPKPKHLNMHNTVDFLRINKGIWGAINFNNMIPVTSNNYQVINLNKKCQSFVELQYYELLKNQYNWLNKNKLEIMKKAKKLYTLYTKNKLSANIADRCCNYQLLEEKCQEYIENILV